MYKLLGILAVVALVSGGLLSAPAPVAAQVVSKSCGRCGCTVAPTSKVGDRCPHCGAVWGSEQTSYASGGNPGECLPPAAYGPVVPQTPWEVKRAAVRARRELEVAATAAARARARERIQERAAAFRVGAKQDREKMARRWLAAGLHAEDAGDRRAAICYYRLLVRSLAGTSAASDAALALARLGEDVPPSSELVASAP